MKEFNNFYQPINLDISNYTISPAEISTGYGDRVWEYSKDIFHLGPTVPPVEYMDGEYLEHPSAAWKYYCERGVTELYAEEKYMGSRATITINNGEIFIQSRNGYPFFSDEHKDIVNTIKEEICAGLDYEKIMLDCEIMPWSLKAKGLIKNSFEKPGHVAKLYQDFTGADSNIDKFFSSLENFTKDTPVEVRVFSILLLKDGKEIVFGPTMKRYEHYRRLENAFSDTKIVKPVRWHSFQTHGYGQVVYEWERFCENGEGFVIKPAYGLMLQSNGYMIQPMLKVRGKEYLRLIYGIDYDEPENFEKIKVRSIKKKRIAAIQESEVSYKMIRAFANDNWTLLKRLASGFIGMENVNFKNVDATL